MNENVVSFDYKTIKVKREMETMVSDAYTALGWEHNNTSMAEGSPFYVNLSFKRDRKINNKIKLLTLEKKLEEVLFNIETLQSKKKNGGVIAGISLGVLGALTFGGGMSMSLVLSGVGYLIGGIALGIVGIGIGAIAYFVSKKVKAKTIGKVDPILESELDKLADICENANALINE